MTAPHPGPRTEPQAEPRIAICLEQSLGHRTYALNLERAVGTLGRPVHLARVERRIPATLPVPRALRGSLKALSRIRRARPHEVSFFHTQTVALFARQASRGTPYAVGVDATPRQMDEFARWYGHRRLPRWIERLKHRWYRSVLTHADGIVAWSQWTADSLVRDYGVDRAVITIVHPGAGREFFELEHSPSCGRVRILMVGGQFRRKGGPELLQAFGRLADRAELVLVTADAVPGSPGVRVVRDAQPGSAELLAEYAAADIFCLPTHADTTGIVIGEAMAAGLPVVTTTVGSIPEWVPPEAGVLVPPGDDEALYEALRALVDGPAARARMGRAARAFAVETMDSVTNTARTIDFLGSLANRPGTSPAALATEDHPAARRAR